MPMSPIARFLGFALVVGLPLCSLQGQIKAASVITSGARIYNRPSVVDDNSHSVPIGTVLRVLDAEADWYVVRIGDVVGWMPSVSLSVSPSGSSNSVNSKSSKLMESSTQRSSGSSSSGRVYTRGPRGGCYYYNASGRKVYVDHSFCS